MWMIDKTESTPKPVETSQDIEIAPGDPFKTLKIGEDEDNDIPKRESGCFCLESRGHAKDR